MRRMIWMVLAVWMAVGGRAFAVESGQVAYQDGTLSVAKGTVGRFDTTGTDRLVFRFDREGKAGQTEIVYGKVRSVKAEVKLARHLGFAPAVAVGMVRHRERKHFVTVSYEDAAGVAQVAQFEIAKGETETLLAIFRARSAAACGEKGSCVEMAVNDVE